MSQPRPDLPISKEAAIAYLEWLRPLVPSLSAIYITGSRSPWSKYPPREDSDWDFQIVSASAGNVIIPPPRAAGRLHADITFWKPEQVKHLPSNSVMIWPDDIYGFFK